MDLAARDRSPPCAGRKVLIFRTRQPDVRHSHRSGARDLADAAACGDAGPAARVAGFVNLGGTAVPVVIWPGCLAWPSRIRGATRRCVILHGGGRGWRCWSTPCLGCCGWTTRRLCRFPKISASTVSPRAWPRSARSVLCCWPNRGCCASRSMPHRRAGGDRANAPRRARGGRP